MYVLVFLNDKQTRSMMISKRKRSLQPYMAMAERKGWAWRLHDGSGWSNGSATGWMEIQTITETCMATVIY